MTDHKRRSPCCEDEARRYLAEHEATPVAGSTIPEDIAAWWREKRYSVADLQQAFAQGSTIPDRPLDAERVARALFEASEFSATSKYADVKRDEMRELAESIAAAYSKAEASVTGEGPK